jgi:hypothetical protein
MSKFLNKYVRKFHRWLALPFVVLILTVFLARNSLVAPWRSEHSKYSC